MIKTKVHITTVNNVIEFPVRFYCFFREEQIGTQTMNNGEVLSNCYFTRNICLFIHISIEPGSSFSIWYTKAQ
jgi:hypothetical protein